MANEPWSFESPLCSQIGMEPFFEETERLNEKSKTRLDYQLAISICKSCIHIAECAEWGIKHEAFGVWGGMTPQERGRIRKIRNIKIDTELKTLQ